MISIWQESSLREDYHLPSKRKSFLAHELTESFKLILFFWIYIFEICRVLVLSGFAISSLFSTETMPPCFKLPSFFEPEPILLKVTISARGANSQNQDRRDSSEKNLDEDLKKECPSVHLGELTDTTDTLFYSAELKKRVFSETSSSLKEVRNPSEDPQNMQKSPVNQNLENQTRSSHLPKPIESTVVNFTRRNSEEIPEDAASQNQRGLIQEQIVVLERPQVCDQARAALYSYDLFGHLFADVDRVFKFLNKDTGSEYSKFIKNYDQTILYVLDSIAGHCIGLEVISKESQDSVQFPKDEEKFDVWIKTFEELGVQEGTERNLSVQMLSHVIDCLKNRQMKSAPKDLVDSIMDASEEDTDLETMVREDQRHILANNMMRQDLQDHFDGQIKEKLAGVAPEDVQFSKEPQLHYTLEQCDVQHYLSEHREDKFF